MICELKKILHEGGHSLVVGRGEVRCFDGSGVSDLYKILTHEPDLLQGAEIADKIIGKGAAALMILGGAKEVYADVISRPALSLLSDAHIEVEYAKVVPNIINRAGTGICPVEELCLECATPEECLPLITEFLNRNTYANNTKIRITSVQ